MNVIEPISGWMLSAICVMDVVQPGFAGFTLRASAERRHVIAAFLSMVAIKDEGLNEIARFLVRCGHDEILRHACGNVPVGFRKALGRCGPQVHEREFYVRLKTLLTDGSTHVVKAVRHSTQLCPDRLDVIVGLAPDLCVVGIVAQVKGKQQAADLGMSVELMTLRGLDRDEIVKALICSKKISHTIRRWAFRMEFPRGPIPRSDHYTPICTGEELISAAKRLRNCSRRYFNALTSGEHAFGEFRHAGEAVMISYDRSQGYWVVAGVYGYNNRPLQADMARAAYAFAAQYGVFDRVVRVRGDSALEALRRMSGSPFEWGL